MHSHRSYQLIGRAGATSLASLVAVSVAGWGGGCAEPDQTPAGAPPAPARVAIGADGFFYLDGVRTIVIGAEEERRVLTDVEVDGLIPRLHETGINVVVVYAQNLQTDHFYRRLGEEGIWVAQHLGTVKEETRPGFAQTGGVIGTIPSEAWFTARLADVEAVLARLAHHDNILFWWMGGEFVEPALHGARGIAVVRDHVRRYRDAIRALDPRRRPFTVSHHYVEALEAPILPYLDIRDLTDFTWFTVATHFHLGDFVDGGAWWPIAQVTEPAAILEAILGRASALDGGPIFLGGLFGQAPRLGPCTLADQGRALEAQWTAVSATRALGFSAYHLDAWADDDNPHVLFGRTGASWVPTPAGRAMRDIAARAQARW